MIFSVAQIFFGDPWANKWVIYDYANIAEIEAHSLELILALRRPVAIAKEWEDQKVPSSNTYMNINFNLLLLVRRPL